MLKADQGVSYEGRGSLRKPAQQDSLVGPDSAGQGLGRLEKRAQRTPMKVWSEREPWPRAHV